MIVPKKLKTGGSVLLAKHGHEYFSKLAKNAWKKRKKAMKMYEEEMAKKKAK